MKPAYVLFLSALLAFALCTNVEGRNTPSTRYPSPEEPSPDPVEEPSPAPGPTVAVEPEDTTPDYGFACNITYAEGGFVCGGILVNSSWVLTAAHCVDGMDPAEEEQRLVVYCNGTYFASNVSEIVLHEKWLEINRLPYDIALVGLETPSTIPVASYAPTNFSLGEGDLYAVEWEKVERGIYEFDMVTDVEYVDSEHCNSKFLWTNSIEDSQFCAAPIDYNDCTSDKGTALFHLPNITAIPNISANYTPTLTLVGISSFDTDACDRLEFPIVYTAIASHVEWIDGVIHGGDEDDSDVDSNALQEEMIANITAMYEGMNSSVLLTGAIDAIMTDNATALGVFLSLGLSPDATVDELNRTLLHLAANVDAYYSAQTLVAAGANVGIKEDYLEATPLHFAAVSGSIPVAKVLLEAGAYVNEADKRESTALHYLMSFENTTIIMLKFLLERGANVHVVDEYGATPLHRAAQKDWVAAAEVLIKYGANLIVYADDNGTPHHWAGRYSSDDTLLVLLGVADVEAKPRKGLRETGLSFAIRLGASPSTVLVFLENGANPNVRDRDGNSPLHRAAERGDTQIINILLRFNANQKSRNEDGYTPAELFCSRFDCDKDKNQETYRLLRHRK